MIYTLKIIGSGASFVSPAFKSKEDYRQDAWLLVEQLAARLWPTDTEYRATVLKWLANYSEQEMRAQLNKWLGKLDETLKAKPFNDGNSGYTWLQNEWESIRWQRAHVQLWAAGITARGFAPPNPIELAELDTRAGNGQDAIAQALVSEAYRRGQNEGQRVAAAVDPWRWLQQIGLEIIRVIERLIAAGEKAIDLAIQSGLGFVLGFGALLGLLALVAYVKR